jgi:hypothetical protein
MVKIMKGVIMSNKDIERFKDIRSHIEKSPHLSDEEKSNSYKHIEEWYAQDQASGSLYQKMADISPKVEALMQELGLI